MNFYYIFFIRNIITQLLIVRLSLKIYLFSIKFQLRDIENTLAQKTRTLESLHYSNSGNSGSEDVSARDARKEMFAGMGLATNSPQLGSPLHPSPRQHSITMEGVQRILEKLSKHSRVEEAAIKRIKDLEMQVNQMREACVVSRDFI